MQVHHKIDSVVRLAQKQINQSILLRALLVGIIFSCSVCLVVNLYFILQGYAPQSFVYMMNAFLFVGLSAAYFLIYSVDFAKASVHVDQAYGLKEALLSYLGFQKKGLDSGVFKLQAEKLMEDLAQNQNKTLFVMPHKNLFLVVMMLLVSMVIVGLTPESARVAALKKQKQELLAVTNHNIVELKQALKELEKSLTDEEKELLEKSKITQAVNDLEESDEKEKAFSDLAKLEQELRKELNKDSLQTDLASLKKLEEEALKQEETKELGKDLQKKDFQKAAEDLKKFELDEKALKDLQEALKNKKELTKEELQELKEKLANQLSSQAKNMKALNKSIQKSLSKQKSSTNSGMASELGELSDELSKIDGELEKLSQLEKMEKLSKEELEELMKNCENCQMGIFKSNSKLKKIGKSLKNLGIQKGYMDKLTQMKDALSFAQMSVAKGAMAAPAPGGLEAGRGVSHELKGQKEDLKDNGQFTQVKGEKGEGVSLTTTEEAASGSGVSRIQGKASKVDFKMQTESFMNREDIPDDLKGGVKKYFNSIHNIEEQKKEK